MSSIRDFSLVRGAFAAAVIIASPHVAAAQEAGPADKAVVRSTAPANRAVYQAAQSYRGTKILVSTNERRLRLVTGRDTLLDVPVGIGTGTDFEYEGRKFRFETPTGRRRVLMKAMDPVWTVPDWHYMEKAKYRGLELVRLAAGDEIDLEDGSKLVVKDGQVGRVNQFGNFWAFTPGTEIIFDGRIFMPPFGTEQRRIPEALGPYKLDLGDGYLLHGTNPFTEDTIGGAVSHGCVRLANSDIDRLYHLVETGTAVFIY
ncbi:MAG: L,D-transpeptidase [Gemmatimonadetes bacterium]|nr:L,D-transpeptidase [Gemmatimonadota bacterium]